MSDFPPPPPPSGFPPPPPPGPFGAPPPPGYTTTYGAPSSAGPMQYAGVGARFGAMLIDGLILALLFIPAIVVIFAGPTRITTCSIDEDGGISIGGEFDNDLCEVPTGGTIAAAILLGLIALAAGVLYHSLLVGRTGQTFGKRATGVRVVDATSGLPIGSGRALGRYLFALLISGNFCLLGYLWAFWDPRKQSWHDKVVSSVVIKA